MEFKMSKKKFGKNVVEIGENMSRKRNIWRKENVYRGQVLKGVRRMKKKDLKGRGGVEEVMEETKKFISKKINDSKGKTQKFEKKDKRKDGKRRECDGKENKDDNDNDNSNCNHHCCSCCSGSCCHHYHHHHHHHPCPHSHPHDLKNQHIIIENKIKNIVPKKNITPTAETFYDVSMNDQSNETSRFNRPFTNLSYSTDPTYQPSFSPIPVTRDFRPQMTSTPKPSTQHLTNIRAQDSHRDFSLLTNSPPTLLDASSQIVPLKMTHESLTLTDSQPQVAGPCSDSSPKEDTRRETEEPSITTQEARSPQTTSAVPEIPTFEEPSRTEKSSQKKFDKSSKKSSGKKILKKPAQSEPPKPPSTSQPLPKPPSTSQPPTNPPSTSQPPTNPSPINPPATTFLKKSETSHDSGKFTIPFTNKRRSENLIVVHQAFPNRQKELFDGKKLVDLEFYSSPSPSPLLTPPPHSLITPPFSPSSSPQSLPTPPISPSPQSLTTPEHHTYKRHHSDESNEGKSKREQLVELEQCFSPTLSLSSPPPVPLSTPPSLPIHVTLSPGHPTHVPQPRRKNEGKFKRDIYLILTIIFTIIIVLITSRTTTHTTITTSINQ